MGCRWQILYFIGLFQHLEDLKLFFARRSRSLEGQVDDPTLIPPFAPPLQGRLEMLFVERAVLEDMINLFRGIRFHYMDLFHVDGMPLLLEACARTLETLRLDITDPHGVQLCPKGVWKF